MNRSYCLPLHNMRPYNEIEIGQKMKPCSPRLSGNLQNKCYYIKTIFKGLRICSGMQHLAGKYKVMSSIPGTPKTIKKTKQKKTFDTLSFLT